MRSLHLTRVSKRSRWVLFAWLFTLLSSLLIPNQPVTRDNYVLIPVCSLLNGIQYVKVALEDYDSIEHTHNVNLLHEGCKCGLNVDHLSLLTQDTSPTLAIPTYQPIQISSNIELEFVFVAFYSTRAPPILA